MKYVILGAPRTKKNHQRIARTRGGKPFIMQAATSCSWEQSAILQLKAARSRAGFQPTWSVPVNLAAIVYRDKNTGDFGGYMAAICDALERAGVVANDKYIMAYDGSRLRKDAANPRVELELSPLDGP